ncbi:MAG: hypothetical protein WAO91_02840 [Candidatus Nitrosotenuis sp.]
MQNLDLQRIKPTNYLNKQSQTIPVVFEFIVSFAAFKYIFVEDGEQALIGIGTLAMIGISTK